MVLFQRAPCTSSPPYFPCAFFLLYEMTSGFWCGHRSVVTEHGRIESYDKGDVIVGRGDLLPAICLVLHAHVHKLGNLCPNGNFKRQVLSRSPAKFQQMAYGAYMEQTSSLASLLCCMCWLA